MNTYLVRLSAPTGKRGGKVNEAWIVVAEDTDMAAIVAIGYSGYHGMQPTEIKLVDRALRVSVS